MGYSKNSLSIRVLFGTRPLPGDFVQSFIPDGTAADAQAMKDNEKAQLGEEFLAPR